MLWRGAVRIVCCALCCSVAGYVLRVALLWRVVAVIKCLRLCCVLCCNMRGSCALLVMFVLRVALLWRGDVFCARVLCFACAAWVFA